MAAVPRVRSFDLLPGCDPLSIVFEQQRNRVRSKLRHALKPVPTNDSRIRDESGAWYLTARGTTSTRLQLDEAPAMPKRQDYQD